MKLVIGNKNYSSWSLRAWLLLDGFGIPFAELQESLTAGGRRERLLKYSASGKVPVLVDEKVTVWDTLAICEYVSERYLDGRGWPEKWQDRAAARAICAEMHAGFSALRSEMPMNCRAERRVELSPQAGRDIARIDDIWAGYAVTAEDGTCRLFGRFSIADCFFAPVVFRFKTYGAALSEVSRAYMGSMLDHPSMKKWLDAAMKETEVIEEDEAGTDSA